MTPADRDKLSLELVSAIDRGIAQFVSKTGIVVLPDVRRQLFSYIDVDAISEDLTSRHHTLKDIEEGTASFLMRTVSESSIVTELAGGAGYEIDPNALGGEVEAARAKFWCTIFPFCGPTKSSRRAATP